MFKWRSRQSARVSVAVPLYNHAPFIAQALESALEQGEWVSEIVVVDDGSTDGSAAVVERLAAKDARVRLIRQANAGAHAAINRAIGECSGSLLAILNSDDAFVRGRMAALAAALEDGADIAASDLLFMDDTGAATENTWYEAARQVHRDGAELGVALLNGNFVMTTSNLLFRRTAWKQVGPFAALRYTHDLDWLLRALALGRRVALVEQPLLRYRVHSGNTIKEDHRGVRMDWAVSAAAYLTTLWDRPGAPAPDWDHAAAAQAVLRRHELDAAAAPCMAYLRRHRAPSLHASPILKDEAFMARVRAWV